MAGNSFGEALRVTTFGESHGEGVGVVIDGCPSRISLTPKDFVREMARRKPGRHSFDSARREEDRVEILSGVFEGLTTGAPLPFSSETETLTAGHMRSCEGSCGRDMRIIPTSKNTVTLTSGAGEGHLPGRPQPGLPLGSWPGRY